MAIINTNHRHFSDPWDVTSSGTIPVSNGPIDTPLTIPAPDTFISVKGVTLSSMITMTDYELTQTFAADPEMEVKRKLLLKIIDQIWNNKCVEFTKELDNLNGNHMCRARIYAVPDDQVRLLRKNNTIDKWV